ncbi:hypothetical protein K0P33_17220 [Pseudomonas sp. ArH3a]|uniref:hypothetical protein n=1 Tax=Pseudomonas sp. ArH3a TaxID=2862945 RepID=UPI001F591D7D|nr:hypothetical protein [Pseudomonas sp. ArH3a]UNM17324.1 hypothetical protein K0P33_17220 [Pseudomonas sp. ArH3a]
MISNYLSMIEELRPASDELAAQVAEYLASGGQIEEAAPIGYKPKPITYSNQMPPAPNPFVRRRVETPPLPADPIDARADRRAKQAEQVKALAPTHTQTEARFALGMTSKTVKALAKEFGFTFKRSTHGGHNGPERKKEIAERDAKFAERIKAFKELGLSRRVVCGRLAISNKTFERIIAAHGIDYPKARQGSTSCAA